MLNLIRAEPVALQGVIQAGLALAIAFGSSLDASQVGAILAFTAAALSFITRTHVTPEVRPRAKDGTPLVKGSVVGV